MWSEGATTRRHLSLSGRFRRAHDEPPTSTVLPEHLASSFVHDGLVVPRAFAEAPVAAHHALD